MMSQAIQSCEPPVELKASGIPSTANCVSKFAGCVAQINARPQSGASPEDNLKKALALYATTEKTSFTIMNCFRILESAPKWQQYHIAKVPATKRPIEPTSDDGNEDSAEMGEPSSKTARPKGRDACKNKKAEQSASFELAKSGRLLAEAAQAKLKDAFQRTEALKRIANHAIMSIDMSGLNSTAKRFYEIEQQRILAETLKEAAAATVQVMEQPYVSGESEEEEEDCVPEEGEIERLDVSSCDEEEED
nr:uncharacterized protein LOC115260207 [Aedes albopictus]